MLKATVGKVGPADIILMNSITKTERSDAGAVVISASHGGASSGEFALETPLTAVFFNDAGIGKDRAGIAALDMLDRQGVAGATVSHDSARIGDAADMWRNGRVSAVNTQARDAGLQVGEHIQTAVAHFGTPSFDTDPGLITKQSRRDLQMDGLVVARYLLESPWPIARAAAILAGEQSLGSFRSGAS